MSQPVPTTPEEAARIAAHIREYEVISNRLREETEDLVLQRPHQWAGMNSEQALTFADTLTELLAKLRLGESDRSAVAVRYLDPDPPELIL